MKKYVVLRITFNHTINKTKIPLLYDLIIQ